MNGSDMLALISVQHPSSRSSQMLFSISQKLIQHQILNYTEILKWLHKILSCQNNYLLRKRELANFGSQVAICKQASIKLEVVLFMYLWSVDIEAVLTAMSCFKLLCIQVIIAVSALSLECSRTL